MKKTILAIAAFVLAASGCNQRALTGNLPGFNWALRVRSAYATALLQTESARERKRGLSEDDLDQLAGLAATVTGVAASAGSTLRTTPFFSSVTM